MDRRANITVAAVIAVLMLFAGIATAEDFVYETSAVRYVISDTGVNRSLQDKETGREFIVGSEPFSTILKRGRYFPSSNIQRNGEVLQVEFGESGISADYRVNVFPDYMVIELSHIKGAGVEEIRLAQLRLGGLPNAGTLLPVQWDEKLAVSLMGLSGNIESGFQNGVLRVSAYPEYGMEGEKAALIAVPTPRLMDTVQKVENDQKLPLPRIDGRWAKTSLDVRSSYLFIDLTEANTDEVIRYAKLGGFKYILIYSHVWSTTLGSYPVNTINFPRGEASLKVAIDKCHAAGLKVGMHMMTSFVGKNDRIIATSPSQLLHDAEETLAAGIDENTQEIVARSGMAHFPERGHDVLIDNEIVHYEAVGGSGSTRLLRCTRGYAGTNAASHVAGARIRHLAEYYGSYVANLRGRLKDEIAERIAGLVNRCGFDMIYFDGGEVNCITGPCWYWGGEQQMSIWNRVKRDLLVQGSGITPWTWHIFSRGNCDDYAAVAPKQYLDYYKIPDRWQYYFRNFLPSELGWWGFQTSAPDHSATIPDEVRFYAARMFALDSPVSLETTLAALKANGRTEEMLGLLGEYETLRLGYGMNAALRAKLRSGEWFLEKSNGKTVFKPSHYDVKRTAVPGTVHFSNEYGPQNLRFRLEAVTQLAEIGDPSNVGLVRVPLMFTSPTPQTFSAGSLLPGLI